MATTCCACNRLPVVGDRRCKDCLPKRAMRRQRMGSRARRARDSKIGKAVRNAVAAGLRRYHQLSAKAVR